MTWLHDFLANQATAQSAGSGEVYPPIRTGPQNAIRATSPASPYARDRVEAPSNRPAARTPTLRSRAQDVVRSAPGALTAARERSVYDTTWEDVGRGAQELTGLPSLARGAGGLAALPAVARSGFLGPQHALPAAGALAETALGLAGPMMLPRSAGRVAAPVADASRSISAGTLDGRMFYRGQGGDIQGGGSFRRNSHISANPETANSYAMMNLSGAERAPTVFPLRGTGRIADRDGVMSVVDELVAGGMSREEALRQAIPELERRGFAGFQMARRGDPEFDDDIQIFNPSANLRSAFDAEPAQRIPNIAREIGPNGMPIAQSQPTRNSFRGGSSDLREAAGMGAAPPVGRISGMPAPEGRRIVYQGGPRPLQGDTLDDAALGTGQGAATFGRGHYVAENPIVGESYARQLGDDGRGFTHELDIPEGPYIDLFKPFSQQDPRAQEAIRRLAPQFNWDAVTSEMSDALTILGRNEQRVAEQLSSEGVRGFRYLDQRSRPGSGLSHLAEPTSNYVVFRGADAQRRFPDFGARTPPPTTPTGTAPFGDPRAYPQSTWEEFGSLQGGTPEARNATGSFGARHPSWDAEDAADMARRRAAREEFRSRMRREEGMDARFASGQGDAVGGNEAPTLRLVDQQGRERHYQFAASDGEQYRVSIVPASHGDGHAVTFQSVTGEPWMHRGDTGAAKARDVYRNVSAAITADARQFGEGRYRLGGLDEEFMRLHRAMLGRADRHGDLPSGYSVADDSDGVASIVRSPPQPLRGGTPEARLRAQEPPPREGPPSLVDLVDDGGGNLIVGAMRRAGVNIQRAEDSGLLDRPMTQRPIPITQLRGTDHTRPAREWVDMFKEDPSEFYPIQVRQRGRNRYDIIDGHHRTQAAREMGQTEIDAYDASLYFPEIRNRWALGAPLAAVPLSGSALTQQQNTTGRPRGRPGFFGGR